MADNIIMMWGCFVDGRFAVPVFCAVFAARKAAFDSPRYFWTEEEVDGLILENADGGKAFTWAELRERERAHTR